MDKLISVLFLLVVTVPVFGQSFSLFEAQEYALANAEKIKRTELDYEIAKSQVVETRAQGLPQVSSQIDFNNFLNVPVMVVDGSFAGQPGELVSFRAGTDYGANIGATVSQLLFDGSYLVGLQVSKFYTEFVDRSIAKSKEEVLFDVTRAYELCLVSRENYLFMDSLVKGTERLVNQQKELLDLGLIAKEDMDQVDFALIQAKTNQSAADYSYRNALHLLKLNMAYPMDEILELTTSLNEIMDEVTSAPLDVGSIYDNIELDLLKKRKVLSEYELKNTRMANLPRLNAFFNHQYNYFSNDEIVFTDDTKWFDQTVVGLSLSVPIVSSGRRWSKTQQAKLALKQDEYTISEFERALKLQEVQYKNAFDQALQQLNLQEKNVKLAQRIYENALVKAEIGKENNLSVTQKYNQLTITQTQYVNAMVDVFTARLNIDKLYNRLNKR